MTTLRPSSSGNPISYREVVEASSLLLLTLVVFFWPAVFAGQTLLPADLVFDLDPLWQPLAPEGYSAPSNALLADQVYQFLPWKEYALQALAEGTLPLWNPYMSGGLPFVGNAQSALFSPLTLPDYLLPRYASYTVGAILRLFVGGIFTFLFARQIHINKLGAILAMFVFTFSGPMIGWVGYPLSQVIVWLPAMLLTIDRALTRRSTPYVVATGLAIGLQFLGGHPETSLQVMVAWAAYAVYRTVVLEGWWSPRVLPQIARIGAASGIGLLLGAIQLLPFAAALRESAALAAKAPTEPSGALAHVTRLLFDWHHWPTVITGLLPQYFGTPIDGSYWYPYTNYVEQNLYVGVIPFALSVTVAFLSVRRRSLQENKAIAFFGALALVCLGIALHVPLLNIVNDLPVFRLAANGRFRLISAFSLALLAGAGADDFLAGTPAFNRTMFGVLLILALTAIVLVAFAAGGLVLFRDEVIQRGHSFVEANWGANPYLWRYRTYYHRLVEERYRQKLALFRPTNIVMYLPALLTFAWFPLHRWRERLGRDIWALGIVGLTLIDLFLVNQPFNPTIEFEHVFPTPGAVRFLQEDQTTYRVSGTDLILYPNSAMLFGLSDVRGYDTVVPQRYANVVTHSHGHYRHHFHSLFVEATTPIWDLLNVKYVLTDQILQGKWSLVYGDESGVKIYRNRDVLPRAFVAHRVEVVEDGAESLARLMDASFDFREVVLLEETPSNWSQPPEPVAATAAQIVDYQPNRVTIRTETSTTGLLVLTDSYASGWKASIDGQPTPVYIADHAFRGVVVPEGAHVVEFTYVPRSFAAGAAVSGATLMGAIVTLAVFWTRRRSGLTCR